jgi:hypothetical protein
MSIDAIQNSKKGIVPKPNGDYKAGTVEEKWNEGAKGDDKNDCVVIAPAPAVHDREHAAPSMGVTSRKSIDHGHSYPGIAHPAAQTPKAVEAKPLDQKVKDKQLGVNGHLGN